MAAAQAQRATSVLMVCVSAALAGYSAFASLHGAAPKWSPLVPLPILFLSVYNYLKQRRLAFQKSRLTRFYQRGVQRLTDSWMGTGQSGEEFDTGSHPYSRDLNLFGSGSVFELLSTARTQVGRARLASWLMKTPQDAAEVRARQEAVQELAPASSLRDELHLLGDFDFEGCEWGAFDEWLSEEPVKAPTLVRVAMAGLSALLVASALALFLGIVSFSSARPMLMGLGVAEVLLGSQWLASSRRVLENVRQFGNDVRVLRQGIELLQRHQFDSPRLVSLRSVVIDSRAAASLRRLERMVNAVFETNKEMFYLPSWLLFLPVQIALGIESWKSEHASELRQWADAWSEFEALNSLACYTYEHPEYVFPRIDTGSAAIRVEGLAHPLLPHDGCVPNDVELGRERRFYLISGSNMAGKSTLLRSIGLAAVLGGTGAPVRAREAAMSCLSVCASIGVSDSLSEGKSRFLAEVEKIRQALGTGGDHQPVLFLFDELFSGTNSTDRRIAAEAVIRELVGAGAIGAVSTHDLTLAEIAELPELSGENVHMASRSNDDPLSFDYELKPGICRQSNALGIIRLAGVSVPQQV